MFGGTLLVISGPCFSQTHSVSLVMSDVVYITVGGFPKCKILDIIPTVIMPVMVTV
jgi:hypothetical protein